MNAAEFLDWGDRVQNAVVSPYVSDEEVQRMVDALSAIKADDDKAQYVKDRVLAGIERTMEIRDPEHMDNGDDSFEKSGPHKYLRREGSTGHYRYFYKEAEIEGHGRQLKKELGVDLEKVTPVSFETHLEEATKVQNKHEVGFQAVMQRLQDLAPKGAKVQGRVKTVRSILGKIVRKPDLYQRAADLNDVTGMRVVLNSIAEVDKFVSDLGKQLKIVDKDDRIRSPGVGNYRSIHLQVMDGDEEKELQVRTARQDVHSDWMHVIYKPENPQQQSWVAAHGTTLWKYAADMSDHFYAVDKGAEAVKPPCPDAVKQTFGCL